MSDHDTGPVRDVLHRYFVAVDRQDPALLASCFTEDVAASYDGEDIEGGRAGVVEWLLSLTPSAAAGGTEAVSVRRHYASTIHVELEAGGRRARAETYAMVVRISSRPGEAVTSRVRGLRYRDELIRGEEGWRIQVRRHQVEWMAIDGRLVEVA